MIDVDSLLDPVSEDSPAGVDLRWIDGDTTFQTIEDNRIDEDPALVFDGEAKSADWRLVSRTAEEALSGKSKDLQLAAWLTEALAQTDGFEGLRVGLRLIHQLLDRFWDTIHPGSGDGEIVLATRAKPLAWLASKAFLPSVRQIPIGHDGHSWAAYEQALLIEVAPPEDAREMLAAGGTTREAWNQTLRSLDVGALGELLASLERAEAELKQLIETCNKRFGYDEAPLLTPLQEVLEEIRGAIEPHVRQDTAAAAGSAQSGGSAAAPGVAVTGPISTRQEALQRLTEVAHFFRQTEPHSPVSYLIERAVRWGGMSLRQLLGEVVKSNDALSNIWETLGIDPNSPDAGPTSSPTTTASDVSAPGVGGAPGSNTRDDDDW